MNTNTPVKSWCLVTGAGSGFGRALALELAAQRYSLLLTDINSDGLDTTARECMKGGSPEVETKIADVRNSEHWTQLLGFFQIDNPKVERRLHLLVNNAGVASGGYFEQLPLETWQWTLDINLMGVIRGCHIFLPLLRKQNSGFILNVASTAGMMSMGKIAAYNASKAAVISISETISAELNGTGVSVTVTCPSFFKTDIIKNGRTHDQELTMFLKASLERGPDARTIARRTLKAVHSGKLYCLPSWDAKLFSLLKRISPSFFQRVTNRFVIWFGKQLTTRVSEKIVL